MSGSAKRLALLLALTVASCSVAASAAPALTVDPANLREVVTVFANFGSRQPGTPGSRAAALAIESAFRRYGLSDIQRQGFRVPVPLTRDARLRVGDREYVLGSFAPNYVRLSSLPPDGLVGPLVYAGDGDLSAYRGTDLRGAIVLLDLDSGQRWLEAALLGAGAVVFVDRRGGDRGELRRKVLNVPLDMPRFYLDRAQFAALCASQRQPVGRPFRIAQTGIAAQADWRVADGENILGLLPGSDPALSRECLLVSAYFDSASAVLEQAPGAEQATGIAVLLEMVRLLSRQRPARSVLFVAFDGHFQAMAGARALADVLRRGYTRDRWAKARELMKAEDDERETRLKARLAEPPDPRFSEAQQRIYQQELNLELALLDQNRKLAEWFYGAHDWALHIGCDLSSGSDRVGLFHVGHFHGNDKLTRFLAPLGKRFAGYAKASGQAKAFQDCITPAQDKGWDAWVPDQFATDAEVFTEAARPSLSLFTINDARPRVDTPFDTPDKVRFDQLQTQAAAVLAVVHGAANDRELVSEGLKRLSRMPYRFEPVEGMIYEFERRKTFLPNTPVPHALVALKGPSNSYLGVRPAILAMADMRGGFRFAGHKDDNALKIDAYAFEPSTGQTLYAPDLGPEGEVKYPREARGRQGLRRPLIVFPCRALNLFDLVDQRYFTTLQQLYVYDARTDSEPRSFGYELPMRAPTTKTAGTLSASYVEPVTVVYAPRKTRVKVTMGMGLLGLRLVLTNADDQHPTGQGFDPATQARVPLTSFQAAQDMWRLDERRMVRQKANGVSSVRLSALHDQAKQYLDQAKAAADAKDWAAHLAAARVAWAYEARAYPEVQGTEADTIKGVLFYLALLLPFAFFAERLLVGSPRIKQQIAWTLGFFLVVYIALRYVHPAFQLLDTPWIILLGFIIMALASVVISLVARRFNEELETLKAASSGQHTADVSRMNTLGAAFALGISNMRRRPLRTAMTAVTLLLLTFTVLSFTSVRTSLRANARGTGTAVVYPGLLVRDPVWSSLEAPTSRILENQFRSVGRVAPRAWMVSTQLDKQMKLSVFNGTATWAREHNLRGNLPAATSEPLTINAILGTTADEIRVTGLGRRLLAGRWLREGEADACVVPRSVAEKLDLGPGSSADRAGLGLGAIEVFGSRLQVVGVIDDKVLEDVVDLDGEPLTPVDFSQLEPEKLRMLTEQQAQKLRLGSVAPPPIDRYKHYPTIGTIILPYERLMALGGTLRSVAVLFNDPQAVTKAATTLMDRFELSAYAGEPDGVRLYSSLGMTSVGGLSTVFIPLIIAALIVLNTMLGAVAERLREIGIFSSIGLAPAHVAMLFLAESCVFANLGVVLGYLGGQTVAKVLYWLQSSGHLSTLSGLSLNYSSTATVGVAIIIIATVLLSSIYPARKAAQLATPDVERRWKLPQPDGHTMTFSLPFMLTGRDGIACNMFLKEYFDSYVDFAGGDFYTDGTSLTRQPEGGFRLALTVWLAPYDLGVSQQMELFTRPDGDDPHVNSIEIRLERISGDDNGWRRTNWLFVNILRRQFLIWRTITPGQKAAYAEQGEAVLGQSAPLA